MNDRPIGFNEQLDYVKLMYDQRIPFNRVLGFKVESLMEKTNPAFPAITLQGPRPVKFVDESGVARDFEQAWAECDAILAPTTPTASFPLGELNEDPLAMYLNDVFAVPASLAGLPAMSVPAMTNKDGLPLGLQIVGKPFDEQGVLNAGLAIEQRAKFSAKPERWWA